jgi:hypothetical protein
MNPGCCVPRMTESNGAEKKHSFRIRVDIVLAGRWCVVGVTKRD